MLHLPLGCGWHIQGSSLPERLLRPDDAAAFALPGAEALSAFADLIDGPQPGRETKLVHLHPQGVSFSLPAMLPDDVPGTVSLLREVDLSRADGMRAHLRFPLLIGRGRILVNGREAAEFDSCAADVDLSTLLHCGRPAAVCIRFDGTRPAGVPTSPMLHVCGSALFQSCTPSSDIHTHTLSLQLRIHVLSAGCYRVRALCCSTGVSAVHELSASVAGRFDLCLSLPLPGDRFVPGKPYEPELVKIQLLRIDRRPPDTPLWGGHGSGALQDQLTLPCGYSGPQPDLILPLTRRDLRTPPDVLTHMLTQLGINGVILPTAVNQPLLLALCRTGIGVLMRPSRARSLLHAFPCVCTEDPPPLEESDLPTELLGAWQLCTPLTLPSQVPVGQTPSELLFSLTGRPLDPQAAPTREALSWLRLTLLRMRAEAIRAGRLHGPLCARGEWHDPEVQEMLKTVLAPIHLGVVMQRGAWWTGSQFFADLFVFADDGPGMCSCVTLEDADGHILARFEHLCPSGSGPIGTIRAALPAAPCVLELCCVLSRGSVTLEQSRIPVYVGSSGPLETAF